MRPIIKGSAPNQYTKSWREAKDDLVKQLGWYCSYCEMGVSNMIEVEHILPRNNGGAPLDWDNFLLSCKYCNTVKKANNPTVAGYVWPDRDNTDLAFIYSENDTIKPSNNIVSAQCTATIDLMGLDRKPGGPKFPTEADTRWIFRLQAWLVAKRSLKNWQQVPSAQMADQIAMTSAGHGFYSIWMTVFANEPVVIAAILKEFKNTYNVTDSNGVRQIRAGGII